MSQTHLHGRQGAFAVTACLECGFDNPRRWISCARCGQLIGPRFLARAPGTDALDMRKTRPWPRVKDGEPGPTRTASEPDSIELIRAPTLADARPLLGQNEALDVVRLHIAESFRRGRATLTLIEGSAGSGRTRVLERASEFAAQNYANVRVYYAACRNHEEGPYAPFSWLLLERFGITPASSPSTVREEMLRTVELALGVENSEQSIEAAHLLGHMAGVPFPGSVALERLSASPHELRERAANALAKLFESDCGGGRLLVLLDDMHRAESDAWEVLETLIRSDAKIAFVVAGDATLETRLEGLRSHAKAALAHLQPLGEVEVAELVKMLLPSLRETPEPFVSALQHRSRGNPSALTELVRALEERGLFKSTSAGLEVDLDKLARGELPLTMGDAIRARLAGLTPAELAVIQHASVVGELFWDGALLALARSERPASDTREPLSVWSDVTDETQLSEALLALEAKRFVVRLGVSVVPGLSEYTFQFAGARAVVYGELPEYTREAWHATVAHWMTLAPGLPAEGLSAALARHLERAGRHVRATEAYLHAAEEERHRLRTSMALRHVERALPLVAAEDVQLRIRVLHEHGSLLTTLGRYDEAHDSFAEIVRLAFRVGARGTGAAALSRIARIHRQRGEHAAALAFFEQALGLFRAADDLRGVASTQDDLAQVHRLLGNLERAMTSAQEALEIRSRTPDTRGQAVSRNTLGFIELDRGNFADAKSQLEAALSIRLSIGDHEGAVQSRIGLGKLAFYQGRTRDALRLYTLALDSARELGSQRLQCHLLNHLAEAQLAGGNLDTANDLLFEARRVAVTLRDQRALSEIQRNLGLVALARSDPRADQQLSAALELARECGTRQSVALAHRSLGRLRAKDAPESSGAAEAPAESSFLESIRIFEECGSLHELARTQAELGFHLAERGSVERAREALTQAYVTMKRLSLPELARVGERLAQL
jgi:tetratricopeptide (TPR) repeat protein